MYSWDLFYYYDPLKMYYIKQFSIRLDNDLDNGPKMSQNHNTVHRILAFP